MVVEEHYTFITGKKLQVSPNTLKNCSFPTSTKCILCLWNSGPVSAILSLKKGFSKSFRYPQHINLLELEALISLIRGLVDRGLGNRRVLCLVDSRVVLGSVCKGRSSRRRVRLRRLGGLFVSKQFVARLVLGTVLGKSQRRAIAFLLDQQVANRSLVVLSTVARHLKSSPLKLRSKLTDCSSHLARAPDPVYNACGRNRGITSYGDAEGSEQAEEESKFALDNKNASVPERESSKQNWDEVVKVRTFPETEPYASPAHSPDLFTDVPKAYKNRESVTQSEIKDIFSVDIKRNVIWNLTS